MTESATQAKKQGYKPVTSSIITSTLYVALRRTMVWADQLVLGAVLVRVHDNVPTLWDLVHGRSEVTQPMAHQLVAELARLTVAPSTYSCSSQSRPGLSVTPLGRSLEEIVRSVIPGVCCEPSSCYTWTCEEHFEWR